MKTKRELRQEAIEQLKSAISVEGEHLSYGRVIEVLSGRPTYTHGAGAYAETLIDLLTDDDEMEDYIKLPKDANGEVIHVGDEMVVGDYRYIVDGVGLADRTDVFFVTDGDKINGFPAKVCRHYRKPTMKDVLWDFLHAADDAMRRGYDEPPSEVFDEFITKLKEVQECE
jgi:hypothetical protein